MRDWHDWFEVGSCCGLSSLPQTLAANDNSGDGSNIAALAGERLTYRKTNLSISTHR